MPPPKIKVLVCGILPPPNFGHSMMYKMLMESGFVRRFDVTFLDVKFWSYAKHKRVTAGKLLKMVRYWGQYVVLLAARRPRYVLFNMSFDKMPFLKDYLFCATGALLGRRVVLHDMGQYLPELYNSSGGFLRTLIGHLLKVTHAVIVMGEKVKRDYAPFFDGTAAHSPARLIVVPGAAEDTARTAAPPRTPGGRTEVLYFSFLSVSKGVWTGLKAVPVVVKQNPNVHFTFAGPVESPRLEEEIKAYIKQEKLENHVTCPGYVQDAAARTAYFRNCDIFMFPTHRDVFGLVLLHAMAESRPVVASREGTIPEILEEGTNGLLFEKGSEHQLAEKILALASDEALRRRMGEANRRRYLEHYTPGVYSQRMIDAIEQMA